MYCSPVTSHSLGCKSCKSRSSRIFHTSFLHICIGIEIKRLIGESKPVLTCRSDYESMSIYFIIIEDWE